jgi:hypothetical protein
LDHLRSVDIRNISQCHSRTNGSHCRCIPVNIQLPCSHYGCSARWWLTTYAE